VVVKRASIHVAFAAVALACASVAAYQYARLREAQRIDEAVAATARAPVVASRAVHDRMHDGMHNDTRGQPREVALARAVQLSKAGAYDLAAPRFEAVIGDGPLDAPGRAALFDLANLYLREGIGHAAPGKVESPAMIEEAKARYRALLRAAPDDWDARYNLERALWLAPETQSAADAPDIRSRHDVDLRDPLSQDLP
jgi:mxaK protein